MHSKNKFEALWLMTLCGSMVILRGFKIQLVCVYIYIYIIYIYTQWCAFFRLPLFGMFLGEGTLFDILRFLKFKTDCSPVPL